MNNQLISTLLHAIPTTISPYMFITAMIIVTVLSLFAIARTVKSIWLAAALPAFLLVVIMSYVTIYSFMNLPSDVVPQDEVQLLGFSTDGTWMYYWVLSPRRNYPITIRVPYSKKQQEAAQEGIRGVEDGAAMVGIIGDQGLAGESAGIYKWHNMQELSDEEDPLKNSNQ